MKKNNNSCVSGLVAIIFIFVILNIFGNLIGGIAKKVIEGISDSMSGSTFTIISSSSTKSMDDEIIKFGKKNGKKIKIEHYGDLEIVDILNNDSKKYDAVWISNSIWLYMLDNSYLVTDSKSIVIDPVVLAVEKSKAEELGFTNEVYNKDILNAIKEGKLKYIMSSVTQTNTGATTYLNFLNNLAGNPEVLTEEMLENPTLQQDLKDFFSGVERVSGDEEYLKTIYLNGEYNAMINYESSLIEINKELVKNGKEPLYLVYPIDGVAINDMPFGYINNDSKNTEKKEFFNKLQEYLRSQDMIDKMEEKGYRSWYGGIKENTNEKVFNKEWGIDTSKYLKDMKYPSKTVITKALALYIEALRKPTHVVFCLDISGSMYGDGLKELKEAMNYILDYETASKDRLQFSQTDKITLITFNGNVNKIYDTKYGSQTEQSIKDVNSLYADGGTNIYDPSIEALKILKDEDDTYTKTVILMTDGESNNGSYRDLEKYYKKYNLNIPIYSITFGDSDESQLQKIADLTNGKVFDGKSGLKQAFKKVRSYN